MQGWSFARRDGEGWRRLPTPAPGFTLHYKRPQAAGDAQTLTALKNQGLRGPGAAPEKKDGVMSGSCSSVQVENTNADFLHLSLKCNLVGLGAREQAGRLQPSELFTARLDRTQPISVLRGARGAVAGGETGSYLLGREGRQLQSGCCSDGITKGFTRLPIGFGAASHARTHAPGRRR